ncbi:DUF4214 domain-containing protein [Octadecabacter sp. 1_MG-2023]|uniref:DUF4214 domain-containing protein n=1 Tax=unclassified Octadecabacter TaxID=196158 RepID=UPI001C098E18|nr:MULTISPECIES: DUF4214 domain-containing protein [unclassified Octadecabacter]MBU2993362.1 DUF4214 domain-containing protein [Octadecabacter sp. B2R22]MDO6733182.1 DUF4214 domain-containing protein [Octadecabacter sp. 1_MG-2023]
MAEFTSPFGEQIDITGKTVELWDTSVAALGDGRTAVSWTEDGNEAVWLRLYDSDANPEGAAIRVTAANEEGNRPSVAVLENGTFIVTYTSLLGGTSAIYSRVYSSDGTSLGSGTQLFTDPDGLAVSPETTGLMNSSSVTVFFAYDEDRFGVFAQLADADGVAIGTPWRVNQTTEGFQSSGAPVALDDGGFVVTWRSREIDGSFYAVMFRTYDADGTARSNEVRVNQYSYGSQTSPDVTVLSDGRFVVTWESQSLLSSTQDGSGDGVYARIYSADGVPEGGEFRVNSTTLYDQNSATIAATPDGGFVIAWMNLPTSASDVTEIKFQRFDVNGDTVGDETTLGESPEGVHLAPDISIGDDGIARIVWNFTVQNSLISNVFFQTVNLNGFATAGDDTIVGTDADEYLGGQGGHDVLDGGAGDDIVLGDGFEVRYAPDEANQIFRLYQATLNRAPDAGGHERWTSDLLTGTATLADVREGFVGSQEFQNKYAGLDDAGFVKELYINVLDRDFDQGEVSQQEIDNWTNRINGNFTRADVVNGFSESQQLINNTNQAANKLANTSDKAVWFDEVYRLYQATLDRAPDATGFENWSVRLAEGRALTDVITGFTNSDEFGNVYGPLDDAEDFVKLLYNNVLGRDFGSGDVTQSEVDGWTSRLSDTFTRANIVQGFSQSQEFINNTAADVKAYVRAQGVDDEVNGGSGTNVLAGGALADTFVFDQDDAGTNTVLDLETWDYLSFEGFGYSTATDLRAHLNQMGNDVVFSHQGTEVTLEKTQLTEITDDMLLV